MSLLPDDFYTKENIRQMLDRLQRPKDSTPLPPLKVPKPIPVGQARLYKMKIVLQDIEPPIWRRFVAPTFMTLDHFHLCLQSVMGWKNAHACSFMINGNRFESKDIEFIVDGVWNKDSGYDAADYQLSQLLKMGTVFSYEYDFGDGWRHEITVEDDNHCRDSDFPFYCIEGERSCPPEDCGGPDGYKRLLAILADHNDPEHDEMRDWLGGHFNSEYYNPKESNREMGVRRPSVYIPRPHIDRDMERKKKKQERLRKKEARKRNR
ncbi:MAG: plasmid pRiA4b ORF-3 family protein [Planctomycetaceae bacterium]|nr:plasmid pRiA4b ORF-3 family protein [Planctomycetaceae bacterium]